jgi:pyruvate-ferredoxin/flavodoxin oxidoreductase
LDSRPPKGSFKEFALKEARFAMLARSRPDDAKRLLDLGQEDINDRWRLYEQLAGVGRGGGPAEDGGDGAKKAQAAEEVKA